MDRDTVWNLVSAVPVLFWVIRHINNAQNPLGDEASKLARVQGAGLNTIDF